MNKTNVERLTQLTLAEMTMLDAMLNNPMLSIRELSDLLSHPESDGLSDPLAAIHIATIYKCLIPDDIYNKLSLCMCHMYILLKYTPRFYAMPDSWHEALIDPMFK